MTSPVLTSAIPTPATINSGGRPDPAAARVSSLDGLRTIAILFVVLYHLHIPGFTGGFVGVNIFYALSGYLITSILLGEHATTGSIHLGRFWLRRVVRLYPGLLAVVIASVALWSLIGGYKGANVDAWGAAILALTYSANVARWIWHQSMGVLAQTWSLAMEEQFYLVWPPILVLLMRVKARKTAILWTLAALVLASSVGGWLLYAPRKGTATPDVYFSPILNVGPLLCGVILAILLTDERVRSQVAGRLGVWLTGIGALGIVAIEALIRTGWEQDRAVFGLVLPLSGVVSMVFIAGIVSRPTLISSLLSLRGISWFGRNVSYSLYLWHGLVIALVEPLLPGILGTSAALLAAVAVAVGGHYAIERPFARVQRKLHPAKAPTPVVEERDTLAADRPVRELEDARSS